MVIDKLRRFSVDGSVNALESVTLPDELFSCRARDIANGDFCIFPGFTDVHVHFREPGFSYKETVESGRAAAARGGYTDVFTMPNLNPVPDSAEHLSAQLALIGNDEHEVGIRPYGAITVGECGRELASLEDMADDVCGFSDDGKGVADPEMMKAAMIRARALGKIISAHCEDMTLVRGGCIHDGEFARAHGLPGICSESEWAPIARDVELARETGCRYHVCHVSTKESVEIIRRAKESGVDITCETAPHYLTMSQNDLRDEGRFKMNPPLRDESDRLALVEGLKDGTIDMIATDHAPHSAEEKSRGLLKSAMGVVGLETAFPVIYTELVKKGVITLSDAVRLFSSAPRKRFGLADEPESFSLWDLSVEYEIRPEEFATKGRSTPFEGKRVFGRCLLTVKNGKAVYVAPELIG
ncbi:MAG: dihydroorotase [Clostridia bacterium]|nr:dihydroorotase [Clostridia bacterium]